MRTILQLQMLCIQTTTPKILNISKRKMSRLEILSIEYSKCPPPNFPKEKCPPQSAPPQKKKKHQHHAVSPMRINVRFKTRLT